MEGKFKNQRTVELKGSTVFLIHQNLLPFEEVMYEAPTHKETCIAIKSMITRGAGAIGVTAGYAMAQGFIEQEKENKPKSFIEDVKKEIEATRPTAQNLFYAVSRVYKAGIENGINAAIKEAKLLAEEDLETSRKIGLHGNSLIKSGFSIQTHCNAGKYAFVDYGTAISPIYTAFEEGKEIFVYVDETGPRNQGARLTAKELHDKGVPHAIIPDNAGAFYMSQGKIDLMIVGADRIAANGDTANKIGTFEKAIVAKTFGVPFYIAAPLSTIDIQCKTGKDIPIEHRDENEVLYKTGIDKDGVKREILIASPGSKALNPAFDVTPAEYITGIITEKGIIKPTKDEILKLFND